MLIPDNAPTCRSNPMHTRVGLDLDSGDHHGPAVAIGRALAGWLEAASSLPTEELGIAMPHAGERPLVRRDLELRRIATRYVVQWPGGGQPAVTVELDVVPVGEG